MLSFIHTLPMATTPHAHDSWLDRLARFGYFVKGIIYALVGVLALQAAFASGDAEGPRGAMRELAESTFGQIVFWFLAVGLFAYAFWKFVQAIRDPDGKGSDAEGIVKRAGYFGSGLVYSALGVWAVRTALGSGDSSGGGRKEEVTAWLLSQPYGAWLVGAAGVVLIGVGAYQAYKAYSASFMEQLRVRENPGGWTPLGDISTELPAWVRRFGRIGHAARAVTYGIIGVFVIVAAVQSDPDETRGLGGALETLSAQTYGPWLLGVVAFGFVCYGAYCFAAARYRVIDAG